MSAEVSVVTVSGIQLSRRETAIGLAVRATVGGSLKRNFLGVFLGH